MKRTIATIAALAIILTFIIPVSAVSTPKAPKLSSLKNTAGGVLVKWKSVKNADKYYVYRKTASTKYKKKGSVTKTSFTDKSAVSGTKYTYKVQAVNTKGKSGGSNTKTITRVGTPTLKTSNTVSALKASWTKVKKASKYVLLFKKASAKKYKVLYSGKKLSYKNDNIASGGKYQLKVKAVIGKLGGAYSPAKTQIFLESTVLDARELVDMKGITLSWESVKKAKGYYIYRSLKSKNSFKRIKTIKGNKLKYVDSDVVSINSYKYYVIAYNGSSKSAKSNIDSDVFGKITDFSEPLYLTIKKGEVYKDIYEKLDSYLAVPYITWKSDNSNVAKVTKKGVITGVKKGKATLKAKIDPALISVYKTGVTEAKTVKIIVTVK